MLSAKEKENALNEVRILGYSKYLFLLFKQHQLMTLILYSTRNASLNKTKTVFVLLWSSVMEVIYFSLLKTVKSSILMSRKWIYGSTF